MNNLALGGAAATQEPQRNNWRTPPAVIEWMREHFDIEWDASATCPDEWAAGLHNGHVGFDALTSEWPTDRVVFVNPPFGEMDEWVDKILAHGGPVATLCPLRVASAWWRRLAYMPSMRGWPSYRALLSWPAGDFTAVVQVAHGVRLALLPRRVAYIPPAGVKASSPAFDSCIIYRA